MRVENFSGAINRRRHRAYVRFEEQLEKYQKAMEALVAPNAKAESILLYDKMRTVEDCEKRIKQIKAEMLTLDKRIVAQVVAESHRSKKDRSGMGRIRKS